MPRRLLHLASPSLRPCHPRVSGFLRLASRSTNQCRAPEIPAPALSAMECTPVAAQSSFFPPPPSLVWDWDATAGEAAGRKRGKHRGGGTPAAGDAGVRCQVEGCGVGLGGSKEYYRKHRVCEVHTKCPRVVVAGKERRFCQQCSRFHSLSEFDQKKRSCRRRLSDHNARRRKPQTDVFAFGLATLPGSLFDNRRQISFSLNKAPLSQVNTMSNTSWTSNLQLSQVMDMGERSPNAWEDSGNIHLSNAFPTVCHDIDEYLPIKGMIP
ncbi:hypothetical protein GUJ93_ZPchr0012g19217 [Zizania palustris]|uniref:SBP-type domain-containing protein n=1 Tax=Zizania palustris TaxID=103762 RepID=A0A8J5WUF2_ZIZPA|nr:hypothetical protein GUJ93_ZPchr0012g19217 [Zizania palustris]